MNGNHLERNLQKNNKLNLKNSRNILLKANIFNRNFSTIAADTLKTESINDKAENTTNPIDEYSIKLILPNFIKPTIKISKNLTFKDLSALIKKSFNFENIEYRTWDHSIISMGNDLRSCLDSGNLIFLRIDNFEWQLLNYDLTLNENSEVFKEGKFIRIFINNNNYIIVAILICNSIIFRTI